MSLFGEIYFFFLAALLLIPAVILGINERPLRYYGSVLTVVFVTLAVVSPYRQILYLAAYCLIQTVLVKSFMRIKDSQKDSSALFKLFICLSVAPLVIFKIGGLMELSIFAFAGISYLTFKSVQMLIEIHDGLIKEVKTWDFLYFLLFFPSFSSGPIDRSRRFIQDMYHVPSRQEYLDLLGDGLMKICLGMVHKFVIAAAFFQGMTYLGSAIAEYAGSTVAYMYCYGFYLFFDFAGYSQMAVGVSYILGIRTPDNFNKPFISADIKEFWDRWHITLSHWFRDFVFSRFMMASIRGRWFKSKLTGATVGFMINMTLMGLWHGLSWNYVLYGVYHGILLSLTEIYQKKSKFYKKHKKEKWYKIVGVIVTFNLVMFGFLIFSGRLIK